ncbi:MAG: Hpt domain-containing protein [Pirellulales bacterium]|nr:Hpt domain-containing protein [Pirellulales bacterium]
MGQRISDSAQKDGDSSRDGATESPNGDVFNSVELLNRCMGDRGLVDRVLNKFRSRFPGEMEEITNALKQGDADRVARVAHRVKGTAASVSAKRLFQAAADVEDASRTGRLEDVLPSIERLREEWEKCLHEAEAMSSLEHAEQAVISDLQRV